MENQGCLVLSGWRATGSALHADAAHAELASLLTAFGDVRALRPAPNAPSLTFVEFCDVRCAAAALDALNSGAPLRTGLPRMQAEFGRMPPLQRGAAGASAASALSAHPVAWAGASAPILHPMMQHHGLMHAAPGSPGGYGGPGWHVGGGDAVHHTGLGPGEVFLSPDGYMYRTGMATGMSYGHGNGGNGRYNGGEAAMAPRSPAAGHSRPGRRAANRSRGGSSDDSDLSSPPGGCASGGGSGGSGVSARRSAGGPPSAASIASAARAAETAARDAARFTFSAAESAGCDGRTTLMVRNIPNKCTRSGLLAALLAGGIAAASVDFVYLPVDFKHRCNLGYAFVNCTSAGATAALHDAFHGRPWPEFRSRKVCAVTYARLQGRVALAAHFRTARFPASNDDALPLLLHHDGQGPPREEVIGVRVAPPGSGAPPSASSGAAGRPAADAPAADGEGGDAAQAPMSDGAHVESLSLSEDADADDADAASGGAQAEADPAGAAADLQQPCEA